MLVQVVVATVWVDCSRYSPSVGSHLHTIEVMRNNRFMGKQLLDQMKNLATGDGASCKLMQLPKLLNK